MKLKKFSKKPEDFKERIGAKPIVCYPNEKLQNENLDHFHKVRKYLEKIDEVLIPPRNAKTFNVNSIDKNKETNNLIFIVYIFSYHLNLLTLIRSLTSYLLLI